MEHAIAQVLKPLQIVILASMIMGWGSVDAQVTLSYTSYNQGGQVYAIYTGLGGSVFAGSSGHIFRTTNMGQTWVECSTTTTYNVYSFTRNLITGSMFAARTVEDQPTQGDLLRSANSGQSWTSVYSNRWINAVYATPTGILLMGCQSLGNSMNTTLYRSSNDGVSWQAVYNGWDVSIYDFCRDDNGVLYAAAGLSGDGEVLVSTDDGLNWSFIGPGPLYRECRITIDQMGTLYFLSDGGRVYRKAQGSGWEQTAIIDVYADESDILAYAANEVYIASWSGLFRSTDGGFTWQPIQTAGRPYSLAIDNNGFLWVGGSGWVAHSIYPTIPPGVPALVTPISGALYQLLTPTMSWQSVTGAAHYQIQVSTSNGFSNPAIDDTTSTTSYTNDDIVLSTDTIYYWRVRGYNLNGYSDWSEIRSFRTFNPNAPTNLAGSSEPGIVHLAWTPPVSPVVSALGYNIYRRTGPSGPFAQLNVEALSAQTVTYNDSISTPDTYSYGVKAIYPPSVESALSNIVSVDATVQISALSVTPAGGIYNQEQSVTLVCPTANAFIYYTMDGSDPVESVSNLYVAPLPITTTTTLKAMAFKALWLPSPLLEETYILLNPPQNVNASQSQSSVLLTWQIPRITTRVLLGYNVYRRFGETGNFIHLNPSVLVTDTQYLDSSIVCGTYYYYVTAVYSDGASDPSETVSITTSLAVSAPEFTPPPGTYAIPQYVRITTATEQDTIYYTRDGSEPSPSSSIYTGIPLIVEVSDTITARAFKYGWLPSEIVVGDYIISPVSVDDHTAGPLQTSLQAAYPNPCRGFSTIKYTVSQEADVTVSVYNIKGQLVRSLVRGSCKSGIYETVWDCKDRHGLPAADGIYVVSLDDGKNRCFLKLMISK